MKAHLIALVVACGLAVPAVAGELDREYQGSDAKATAAKTSPVAASKLATATELDKESPTQAWRRGGWGGGFRGGWGHGWGRGWGWGHVGWYRPYHGFYGSWGWPSYYSYWPTYYYPTVGYAYYPGYVSYGYPGYVYVW